jgi:GNAT superfamily N-acetyltransferase
MMRRVHRYGAFRQRTPAALPARYHVRMSEAFHIELLSCLGEREIAGLADVLVDCVQGGASVSFMWPMSHAKASAFWRGLAPQVESGECLVLAALDGQGRIVGTVQLLIRLPENQPHRADLAKMLVHRDVRRRGVGALLLSAAESAARAAGRTLLVLDTASPDAARLYARAGWQRVGEIPGYAFWPGGGPCATTVFYKSLG